MEETIRILSDLHLGHAACRIESVRQLRPLLEGAGTVVLNGDTAELRHSQFVENGRRQLDELQTLASELDVRLVFLRGNHDPDISDHDHLEFADGRVFLTHGDALFRLCSPWNPRTRALKPRIEAVRAEFGEGTLRGELNAILECTHRCRSFSPEYEGEFKTTGPLQFARTALRMAWPVWRPFEIARTWMTAPGLAHDFSGRHRPDARVFLFGHTHWPGVWVRGERRVVNTGGFLSVTPALTAEITGNRLTVHRVLEERGEMTIGDPLEETDLS